MLSAKVGNRNLSTNTYASGNGQMTKQTYGNGASITYTYDILGRVKTATYADGRKLTYAYNGEGQLHSLRETGNGTDVTYVYTYDSIGRLIDSQQLDGSNIVIRTNQAYNSSNQMTKQSWQVGGDSYAQDFTYNSSDGSLNTFAISRNGSELTKFTMGYDGLRRLTSMSSGIFTRNYAYRDISGSQTTTQVQSVEYTKAPFGTPFTSAKYSYTYDDAGNILTATDYSGNGATYTYDNQGQLLTEQGNVSGFGGAPFNYSGTYTYDTVGNILTASDGETTHTYTYGDSEWKDLLTAYDGESITYDAIGNPTSYYNGNRWTFGWENGRQLTSLSKQPPVVITTQPENYYGTVGGTATFTVAASGDRVTYQWQRSTDDGETWSNISGGTSTTLSIPIQASVNGYLYRCIAKDYMGHIATSQAGKLTVTSSLSTLSEFEPEFTVINEPDDYYGRPGDIATFIVEAEGANLSYQWLCRAPGADNFEYLTSSDATTNTLRVEMTAASNGAEYRCFITDANGDMGSTRVATIKLDILDWEMEYNTSGIRTKRVSEEKTYNYIYAGDKLMRMTVGNDTLDFSYDTNGVPLTMTYNGTVYYYITNLQGDVISLELADGGSGAQYAYDAWGNIIAMSGTLAELNPLRYRRYVYDQETGFYYLNSRYYDPAVGRFINADSYTNTERGLTGFNMFAYCGNNPVMGYDPSGEWSWGTFASGAGLLATGVIAIAVGVSVITCGAAAPLMIAVATVTASAGTLTAVNGAAEIAESITGYNAVRDGAFGGNTKAYDTYRTATKKIAEVGTMICGSYAAAKGGSVCFVAGTLVLAAAGELPIEEIEAGDYVWAWDEETGDVALKQVVETYVSKTDELVHLHVNGEEIVCTPTHPFYSPVKGWTDAVQLRAGDILVLVNGDYVVVEKVQHEILEAPVTVYNFQVEDYHTYFVASSGVLVHNTCATQRGLQRQKAAGMTNTSSITAPSGKTRIPDYLNASTKVMGEAKSVKYLTKSNQLMDMFQYADANGYKMFLKIERWTRMSKPLQQAIQKYGVYVNIF